jgi:hypothetical protein
VGTQRSRVQTHSQTSKLDNTHTMPENKHITYVELFSLNYIILASKNIISVTRLGCSVCITEQNMKACANKIRNARCVGRRQRVPAMRDLRQAASRRRAHSCPRTPSCPTAGGCAPPARARLPPAGRAPGAALPRATGLALPGLRWLIGSGTGRDGGVNNAEGKRDMRLAGSGLRSRYQG